MANRRERPTNVVWALLRRLSALSLVSAFVFGPLPALANSPAITLPSSQVVGFSTTVYRSIASLSGTAIQITGFPAGASIRATISVPAGQLNFPTRGVGLTFIGSYTNVSSVVMTGTLELVNQALADAQWKAPNYTTSYSLTITVSSGSNAVFGNHEYQVVTGSRTWTQARDHAATLTVSRQGGGTCQGYLVTITSADENAFIKSKVSTNSWIGASDAAVEGTWRWVTGPENGQALSYENWASGEPNDWGTGEDYGQFYNANGLWNDLADSNKQNAYIAEFGDSSCTPLAAASEVSASVSLLGSNAPSLVSSSSPTGDAVLGSTLSSNVSFSGDPAPSISYQWQTSENGETWSDLSGANLSQLYISESMLGKLLRVRVTATNTSGTLAVESPSTIQVLPPKPSTPDLAPISDTGASAGDNITREIAPEISVSALVEGAVVDVSATNGALSSSCSFVAFASTGSCMLAPALADGTWSVTASQTINSFTSIDSQTLTLHVDTQTPSLLNFEPSQALFNSEQTTFALTFSENVYGLDTSDFTLSSESVSCNLSSVTLSGSSANLSLSSCSGDGNIQVSIKGDLFSDAAGNPGSPTTFSSGVTQRDSTSPSIVEVTSETATGLYLRGESIGIQLKFSEPVVVEGTPTLTLETGNTDRSATYISGSTTDTLNFRYTVQSGDTASDLAYVATNSLALNSGAIKDASNNNAILTLPDIGSAFSLDGQNQLAVDGEKIGISISRATSSAENTSVSWILSGTDALACNSLSTTNGVDFVFTGLNSIDSITSSNGNRTCTISGTSSILPARFGVSALSLSELFSVSDALGFSHTQVTVGEMSILVSIAPAAQSKGDSTVSISQGVRPTQVERKLTKALLPGVASSTLESLKSLGITDPAEAAPKKVIRVDHSGVSSPTELLSSRVSASAEAGDRVAFSLELDLDIAAASYAATYIKSGSTWLYGGSSNFVNGTISTNEFSFTQPGIYEIRIYVVPVGTQVNVQSLYQNFGFGFQTVFGFMTIPESSLPTVSQSMEVVLEVTGNVQTFTPPPQPAPVVVPPPLPVPVPTPSPTPAPTPTPSPVAKPAPVTPAANPTPSPSATPVQTLTPTPTPTPSPTSTPTPITSETPSQTPSPIPSSEPTTPSEPPIGTTQEPVAAPQQEQDQSPVETVTELAAAVADVFAEILNVELPPVGEPVANEAIGASGDDSVIVEFDPVGSPEAVEATNKLVAATGAIVGVAAAAGAAAAAAAAAGAAGAASAAASAAGAAGSAGAAAGSAGAAGGAGSAGSASSAANTGSTGAEMSEDAMDTMAEAAFDLDVFEDAPPGRGDALALWAIPALAFLDRPTRIWTRKTARFSPLLSKLLNDGIYLRAMFGSVSVLPMIAAVVLAVLGLQENAGTLLHPPVAIFMAIAIIGIFDSFAGILGISVFVLGSLPLVNPLVLEDWRMLAGTMVAGFGPILLARSIRNFRRRPIPGVDGLIARIGDIAFASLMGGWVAGLVFRALPALTGLTVPAANYVSTFQFYATIAIAVRILFEDAASRLFPRRMDELAPDEVPSPPTTQVVISHVMKYLFYVFVASAFMGTGPIVWIASALFMAPALLEFVKDKLPTSTAVWRWLPIGLPGLAMVLGLEIVLENTLSGFFGDRDDFSIIFIFALLAMIITLNILGAIGREGKPGEVRLFEKPGMRWVSRVGGLITFILLVQFTSML